MCILNLGDPHTLLPLQLQEAAVGEVHLCVNGAVLWILRGFFFFFWRGGEFYKQIVVWENADRFVAV